MNERKAKKGGETHFQDSWGMVDGRLPVTKMRNRPVGQSVGIAHCTGCTGFRGLLYQVKIKTCRISDFDIIVHVEYDGDNVKLCKLITEKSL